MSATSSTPKIPAWEDWLRRYATQATVALSVVIGLSGVMLFFHLGEAYVKELHEWLGMAFVVVAVAHAVRHRHSVVAMVKQPRMRVLFAAAAVVTAAFVFAPGESGGNPFHQTVDVVLAAPIKDVAPLVGTSADELAARLNTTDTSQSIQAIARAQGVHPAQVLSVALGK